MLKVLRDTWALQLGLFLLMIGNGMQGTLLGIRGKVEGMEPFALSLIMSAYFLGFLFSARMTPRLIARVGHVRVFAAFASIVSAMFILYAALPKEVAWFVMRVVVGFCLCGVYIVAESWLNSGADNKTRGQALSVYMIVQLVGIIVAQGMLNIAPPEGYILFVIISVLVSISVAPILLSVSPVPVFQATRAMSLRQLYRTSPLGVVSACVMGAIFSAQFGMSAVYGSAMEFSVGQISIFVGAIYLGALIAQYPVGWLSDRMDRRQLIIILCAIAALVCLPGAIFGSLFWVLALAVFVFGAMSMPLYSLILAYTNDYLEHEDMAAASGGLLMVNGIGAILGAPLLGALMDFAGPWTFFAFLGSGTAAVALYALYRMTQRPAPAAEETLPYAPVLPQATPVAVEATSEVMLEMASEQEAMQEGEVKPATL
ncbi:MAG: MFS transporter [Alphaproteobacteria bacterium]|nr:MAG: MFS transporter [Alphaproteobacteria bacterium]